MLAASEPVRACGADVSLLQGTTDDTRSSEINLCGWCCARRTVDEHARMQIHIEWRRQSVPRAGPSATAEHARAAARAGTTLLSRRPAAFGFAKPCEALCKRGGGEHQSDDSFPQRPHLGLEHARCCRCGIATRTRAAGDSGNRAAAGAANCGGE